jgi:acyl-CoA synthetase (AMP-forming)/AMP-acid ligase II
LSSPDVLAAIVDHTRTGPNRPAVKDLDRDLTYGALFDEMTRVAAGLRSRGVGEGDRVALLLPNSVDFVVTALASSPWPSRTRPLGWASSSGTARPPSS